MRRIDAIYQIVSHSLTRKGLLAAILLTTVLLTAGYLWGQLWLQAPVVFLLGILWGVCVLRDINWVSWLLFMVLIGMAGVGYLAGLSPILMLAAGCTTLIAWDLHQFEERLLDLDEPATKEMEKQHLLRLLMVLSISFIVIAATSMLQIHIRFIVLVLVTLLTILVLNQVMLLVLKVGRPAPPKK